jgi:malic enzyme
MHEGCLKHIRINWLSSTVYICREMLTVDDIQGTGCVTQAAVKSAVWVTKGKVADQKIVIFGAGTAGTGDFVFSVLIKASPINFET